MPEAGEDSARTLSPRPGTLGARKNPRVTVYPSLSVHVYDAPDETVSTDRQTKTDASLILVDLLKQTGGYEPNSTTARITSRGEKLEEREGASLVTFPHSFIFIGHVYSTVLVCIILL